jgi:hypothetical protein
MDIFFFSASMGREPPPPLKNLYASMSVSSRDRFPLLWPALPALGGVGNSVYMWILLIKVEFPIELCYCLGIRLLFASASMGIASSTKVFFCSLAIINLFFGVRKLKFSRCGLLDVASRDRF